jgi:tetratricopeptide (TPR) repeat protein
MLRRKLIVGICVVNFAAGVTAAAVAVEAPLSAAVSQSAQYINSGDQALNFAQYAQAESIYTQALNSKSSDGGARGVLLTGLGEAQMWQGKFSEAASSFKKALSLVTKAYGENSLQTARWQDANAWLSQAQGRADKAEEYCAQALATRRSLAPDQPVLAESLEHMAALQETKGLYNDADAFYRQALSIREKTSGQTSPAVADLLERLGHIALRRGKAEDAKNLFMQSLDMKYSLHAALQQYVPHSSENTVVYRYYQGAPNCARNYSAGNVTQRIIGDNVVVEASMPVKATEFAKTCKADIRVINQNNSPVDVMPQPASLVVLSPKVKLAQLLDGDRLARDVEKKGESKAKWIRFWGAEATTPVTTTVYNPAQPVYPYAYGGAPFGYAAVPPGWAGRRGGNPYWTKSGTTTITTQVPDWQARAEALAKAQRVTDDSRTAAQSIRETALGPTTVPASTTVEGNLNFDSEQFDRAILRVPVGNAVFEFHFDKNQS